MATLLTCQAISKHFGTHELFDGLSISFEDGERVGFLGPNGAGKTTFLKILAGLQIADAGNVSRRRSARICFLPQEDSFPAGATVESVLVAALDDLPLQPHEREKKLDVTLHRFGFSQSARPVEELSGGWRKRLALAREMIREPDLLLMDEPTNHLDLEGIAWLEALLSTVPFAFLAVSHDRYLLERVTTRVVELNPIYPDGYFSAGGRYSEFLEKRAAFLDAQQAQQASLDNIVRREIAFLRSNSKAQRTKSKARIEEAYRVQDELRDVAERNTRRMAGIDFDGTGRQSRKLLEAKKLAKSLGGKLLFRDVSLLLSPGTRLGLLGANGSGKTTLIRVLTGELPADEGTIRLADDLKVVVFDQTREALPQDVTLREALAGKSDRVVFRGRQIHISGWSKRFLFRGEQLDMPVRGLSGGEQARILIARLMLQPADLLILDEPTNDLDMTSLDVLEESLHAFPGALVLVTHDRFMLDRICKEFLGLDGDGNVGKYADCADWQAARAPTAKQKADDSGGAKKPKEKNHRGNLTASEKKELQCMEETIQEADEFVELCRLAAEDPAVAGDHVEAQKRWESLVAARKHVEALYARWEVLEAKAKSRDH